MQIAMLLFGAALQQAPATVAEPGAVAPPAAISSSEAAPAAAKPVALDGDQLDDIRGGQSEVFVLTEQKLSAINGSQMQGTVIGSGQIMINGSAFTNFDGVGNFIMNTGHQNNIQSAVNLSIVMAAKP